MDGKPVSAEDYVLDYLARKHGTTVERVKDILKQTGWRSRREIEETLHRYFQHQPTDGAKEHAG